MTTTPNPTAEQIASEALKAFEVNVGPRGDYDSWNAEAGAVVAALRAHNLLSEGAPSEEQLREMVANLIPLDLIHDRQRPGQPQDAFEAADRIIAALTAAGVAPQESCTVVHSTAAASALCDEVIAGLGDDVRTHGPDCYRWHVGCLALRVRQALTTRESSEFGDAATVALSPKADKDREELIAEARRHFEPIPDDPDGALAGWDLVERLCTALAAQPVLDESKVAEELLRLMREEAMLFDNGTEEWIAESDPVECLPPLAHALCEAAKRGELS